jgi:hypothetical protein
MTVGQLVRKPLGTARAGYGATLRRDRWWAPPWATAGALVVFIVYSMFSAFVWTHVLDVPFEHEGYISPLFAIHSQPAFFPSWLSPAIILLWIPLGFRVSCYYGRKVGYRAFLADPAACAVGEPAVHRRYTLEAGLPFSLQNAHRYFLYLAFIPAAIGWIDAVASFTYEGSLRIGLGGILLVAESIFLTGYILSCHSMRHFVGGRIDCYSCSAAHRTRHGIWQRVSALNRNHPMWFWSSLGLIILCDLYIRALVMGLIVDPSIAL